METAIDELCEKLNMDPLEFRLLNSAKEGTRRPTGPINPKVGYIETLQAAKDHPHYARVSVLAVEATCHTCTLV